MRDVIGRFSCGDQAIFTCNLRTYVWIGLLAVIGIAGCKKSDGTVPVHGHLTLKGQPVANATLTFYPQSGRPVSAAVDQGQYSTRLLPGDYTATVALAIELPKRSLENEPVPPPKNVLPEEYTTENKSTLKRTIKSDQSEAIDFDLK